MRFLIIFALLTMPSAFSGNTVVVGNSWSNSKALDFGSSNSTKYLTGGTSAHNLSYASPWTMSFWISFENVAGGLIISKETAAGTGWDLRIASDKFQWYSSSDAAAHRIQWITSSTFTRSTYHHVCLVYSGNSSATGFTLYVDNSSATITTQFNNIVADWTNSTTLTLAAYNSGAGGFFPGKLDEFTIYNTNLSGAQCTALYNSGHPTDPSTLSSWANVTSYYRMGDLTDTNSTIVDRGTSPVVNLTGNNLVSGDLTSTVP